MLRYLEEHALLFLRYRRILRDKYRFRQERQKIKKP